MRKKLLLVPAMAGAIALILAGCSAGEAGEFTLDVPDLPALEEVGEGEGQVNIIAWSGFVEDGSTNPDVDWVTPFTEATGCVVNRRLASTSDEMVTLMRTGEYDLVSASGDASLRLIAGGDVSPINLELVPNFGDVVPGMVGQIYDTINGNAYGIPIGRGANVLAYNPEVVTEAPTSWADVWSADSPYAGQVTAYDSPIYIADAAVYLMYHEPELGITNPYALDEEQLAAAVELLQEQNGILSEYWTLTNAVSTFTGENTVLGTSWQILVTAIEGAGAPIASVLPQEGSTGWSDTWMISSSSANPNCAYLWLDYSTSPEVNAAISQNFGMAPANLLACEGEVNEAHCDAFFALDEEYFADVWYWTTPLEQCIDGRTDVRCTGYQEWTEAWATVKG